MPDNPRLSILIATKNRKNALQKCLESVVVQNHKSFEIIVLDDASDALDVKKEVIDTIETTQTIQYDKSESSRGVSGARDHLIKMSQGDILVFMDDDAFFENTESLNAIEAIFNENDKAAIVAPKIIFEEHGKIGLQIPFSRFNLACSPSLSHLSGKVSYYVGACHAIRRDVIEKCGGYFGFSVWGEEELDLAYRAIDAGFELYYEPNIIVHHRPEPSLIGKSTPSQTKKKHGEIYHHTKNRFILSKRYLPTLYIPSYISIWLFRYFVSSLIKGVPMDFFEGIRDGFKDMKNVERQPVSRDSVAYLHAHYGRLWF